MVWLYERRARLETGDKVRAGNECPAKRCRLCPISGDRPRCAGDRCLKCSFLIRKYDGRSDLGHPRIILDRLHRDGGLDMVNTVQG